MREIEIKFKVENIEDLITRLVNKGCTISDTISQKDTIYVGNLNDTESREGATFLRVRKTDNKIELNYKKQSNKLMESQEIEFGVDSYEKANEFLKALGFQEWVQVNKKRRNTTFGAYNICIDEVERLGNFVEIELLIQEKEEKDYEAQLLSVAKELGISTENRVNSHYDTMIAELK